MSTVQPTAAGTPVLNLVTGRQPEGVLSFADIAEGRATLLAADDHLSER
ncbi:hypothetical protein HMPREF9056_01267 [Actinomyces sp. oral taxon 170 str. F0386]|nr:hypothetical protein HMPREF9056_01267 [Actinomyces sp. oral taxon 170 str. F0386]